MNDEGNRGAGVQAPVNSRSLSDLMRAYDALPPPYRVLAREAAYNIDAVGLTRVSLAALRAALRKVEEESVLGTYGADHPQSGRS